MTDDEILEITSTGSVNLSILDMAVKAIKGISNPKLLLDLNYLRIQMNEMIKHYKNFPEEIEDISSFEVWKENTTKIYNKIINTSFG